MGDFEHLSDSSRCSDGGVFIDNAESQAVDKETMMYPDQDEETGDKVWVISKLFSGCRALYNLL